MTKEELLQKLTDIEWDDFECKAAQDKLPDDVWSTVSAFSNTSGGWVVFGIKQHGKLVCSTITYWFGGQASGQASGTVREQPREQVGEQPREQVVRLVNAIREDSCNLSEILRRLGLKGRRNLYVNYIVPAIEGGYILRSYPDKPNHPQQRYYLSEKGLKLVK